MSEDPVADHLGAAFHRIVSTIHLTKQLMWASPDLRSQLRPLLDQLGEHSRALDEAITQRSGRPEELASPSGLHRPNLLGQAHNDVEAALAFYRGHLTDLVADLRTRANQVAGTAGAALLCHIATALAPHSTA